MTGISLEFILMLGYAISLAFIALLLEGAARHAHRRSLRSATAGFAYHADRDIWRCPQDQHLFPVFSDPAKGVVIYRAPAAACNSCRSKAACTDSNHGREIERRDLSSVEYGMKRFHHAISITLLVLASLIVGVEVIRDSGLYPRIILIGVLTLLCMIIQRLFAKLFGVIPTPDLIHPIDKPHELFHLKAIGNICFKNVNAGSGQPQITQSGLLGPGLRDCTSTPGDNARAGLNE